MEGSRGTLGVHLAQPIQAQAVTIDHIAKPLLPQYDSAPKEVEVWIIPYQQDSRSRMEQRSLLEPHLVTATAADLLDDVHLFHYSHGVPGPTFISLVNLTYDIHASWPVQTFHVADSTAIARISTNSVLFRFRNNWGNDAYTCIYRVRVHGDIMNTS